MNKENEENKISNIDADAKLNFKVSTNFTKKMFKLLSTVGNETKFNFDKDKITTKIVDPAHVEMIMVEIPIEMLDEYCVDKNVHLGFDLDKLNLILKSSGKNDYFNFVYNNNTFNADIQIGLFKHEMHLIDTAGMPDPKIPNFELPGKVFVDTNIFYNFLVQASNISDHVQIKITKDYLQLYAEGDIDKVDVTIEKNLLELLECYSKDGYVSLYSVDYLLNSVRQLKTLYNKLELNLGNDNPLRITGKDKHETIILLAPRIEDD